MRTAILVALTLAMPLVYAAEVVWKWVDAQGVTHYSDRPVPGAERIQLKAATTTVTSTAQNPTAAPVDGKRQEAPGYRNVEIWKPSNNQVFFNVAGTVEVSVRVEPNLRPQHRLSLYLDGRLVEGHPSGTTDFSLSEVFRGSHQVVAVITDSRGTRIEQTEPVTFHVRQHSIIKAR